MLEKDSFILLIGTMHGKLTVRILAYFDPVWKLKIEDSKDTKFPIIDENDVENFDYDTMGIGDDRDGDSEDSDDGDGEDSDGHKSDESDDSDNNDAHDGAGTDKQRRVGDRELSSSGEGASSSRNEGLSTLDDISTLWGDLFGDDKAHSALVDDLLTGSKAKGGQSGSKAKGSQSGSKADGRKSDSKAEGSQSGSKAQDKKIRI
ncbi:hypothetical protein SARC_06755 [Sphaeroforma arctica JP610]|uniref:Uncharacterized protein n=1 Tax=Sphaeroforma arctica JP610 TaxID=667725 RepID=A0A0L0FY57_9EUKA|nr:hypothetical protein SARC_06755 [Sphaeroforma arctica JP610]KNC80898.1 hypothetical protein SARC_06755 [Sphaeroforma arctica JP610]|eukprot:XP_014154800.1 hypothetical protein SARC_06755 [Sphaeroforma arctica JP610]